MYRGDRYDNSMYRHDTLYPIRSKFIERPDMLGQEVPEEKISDLNPEVELIARASYKLGHAEANAMQMSSRFHEERERNGKLEEKLSSVRSDRDTYKDRYERSDKRNDELLEEVAKLNKKLKPKKAVKKVAKNGRKTRN